SPKDRIRGTRLEHGSHRIGHFLGDGHDKWWHLCEMRESSWGSEEYRAHMREITLRHRQRNWTAHSYENEDAAIAAAVVDVTRDVEAALTAVGIATSGEEKPGCALDPAGM